MNHKDKTFENERVELVGDRFHNCIFTKCELVFDGHRSPTFSDNEFMSDDAVAGFGIVTMIAEAVGEVGDEGDEPFLVLNLRAH